MQFRNGRQVSPLVFQAIRYVTKVGVITRSTWNELFSKGSLRWRQKQLRLLVEGGIFKPHPCDSLVDTFIMGSRGQEMAQSQNWKSVYFIQPQFIKHDETVAKGIWKLERHKLCSRWITERELKGENSKAFKLNVKEGGGKYPDIVFRLQGKTSSAIVALEYEKTGKSSWRYNKAMKAYTESQEFKYILFIVEDLAIENRIKAAVRFIGDSNLKSKLGFIDANEWKNNPFNSPIKDLAVAKSLNELSLKT